MEWLLEFEGLAEARKVDDLQERLAADRDLLLRLQLTEFEGILWDELVDVLIGYGYGVIIAWIKSGVIVSKCRQKGLRGVYIPTHLHDRVRRPDVSDELAKDTVADAVVAFRDDVLKENRWDPSGGASLKTFFVGQALIRFVGVIRTWVRQERHVPLHLDDEVDRLLPDPRDPVKRVLLGDELERVRQAINDPLTWRIAELAAEGMEQTEIAEIVGLPSARAVEARLYRARKRLGGRDGAA